MHNRHLETRTLLTPLLLLGLLLCAGCAGLSEAELEAREYRRVDHAERFRDFRRRCLNAGGFVHIDARHAVDRDGVPKPGDRYYCT